METLHVTHQLINFKAKFVILLNVLLLQGFRELVRNIECAEKFVYLWQKERFTPLLRNTLFFFLSFLF